MKYPNIIILISFIIATLAFPIFVTKESKELIDEKHSHSQNRKLQSHFLEVSYAEKYNETMYCSICEFLINQGEEYITKNTSETDAFQFLEHLCHKLPKSKHQDCDQFVEENYEKLIDFIVEKESAQLICSQLHFCDDYEYHISECEFCKYVSHRIEFFLSKNNTLNDIIDYGQLFCNSYKKKYGKLCSNFLSIYYSQIIAKIIDQYNFSEICSSIAICH